jgi:hypothetical protein
LQHRLVGLAAEHCQVEPAFFFLVHKLEEQEPGQVLGILHHAADVVIAAQDVARAPHVIAQRLVGASQKRKLRRRTAHRNQRKRAA